GETAKPAVPILIATLEEERLCRPAAEALGKIGPPALPAVSAALKHKNAQVRCGAIAALGNMGAAAKPAVPALVEFLDDERDALRQEAAEALGNIGVAAEAAVPALIEALRDPDGKHRRSWADHNASFGGRVSAPDDLRRRAGAALAKIGPAAVSALIGLLAD